MKTRPRYHGCSSRGAALTELAICLLPLGVVFLGIMLFSNLMLGRQEASKLLAWYLYNPSAKSAAALDGRFYRGSRGKVDIRDKRLDTPPQAASATEEPVLPYGDRVEGTIDLVAAIERSLDRVIMPNGEVVTHDAQGVARKLARLGLVTNYTRVAGSKTSLDRDNPSATAIVAVEVDENTALAVARILGGSSGDSGLAASDAWLRYTRVEVDSFTGGLGALSLDTLRLPYEDGDDDGGQTVADRERFRGEFTVRGGKIGKGKARGPLALLEGVSRDESVTRGDHVIGSAPDVRLEQIPDHIRLAENNGYATGEPVDPRSDTLMRRPLHPDATDRDWSKSRGLR